MNKDEIIQYYDYLMRLAVSKCGAQTDAEDLVGETMLAAFACLHKGGVIAHPKTWLSNTLLHKYNDSLRRKYRAPVTVNLDDVSDLLSCYAEEEEYALSEEAARVRRELNHLAYITREVMVRYYFGAQSVAEISEGLGIPEGTVKSRLYAGRDQVKKGLETMEPRENYIPGRLNLAWGGRDGRNYEPTSLVEDDLIAQNLLILAYDKPVSVSELSRAIGIPAAYIEPIIEKLVSGELMVRTDSGRVYTDFIITRPQMALERFRPQLDFAHRHFEVIWGIVGGMSERIAKMPFVAALGEHERTELDRFAVLMALQDFKHSVTGRKGSPKFPARRDGGSWIAQATAFDAGYDSRGYDEAAEYAVWGGCRTSEAFVDGGERRVRFCEFDTTLWDCPCRYGGAYKLYFKHIIALLWGVYTGVSPESSEIPNEFTAYIPKLERFGMLRSTPGGLGVAIPVLKKVDYDDVCTAVWEAIAELQAVVGDEFASFISAMKTPLPRHLTSVPELFRYTDATRYFVMAVVREAYEKGLHMKGVDYCCPPVVMVYWPKKT